MFENDRIARSCRWTACVALLGVAGQHAAAREAAAESSKAWTESGLRAPLPMSDAPVRLALASISEPTDTAATTKTTQVQTSAAAPAATSSVPQDGQWHLSLAPYVWLPAQTGSVTVRGHKADVDMDVGDTIDAIKNHFNFGLCLHMELGRDRWTFMADGMYLDLKAQKQGAAQTQEVGLRQGIFELGGAYSVLDQTNKKFTLEPLAGVRVFYVRLHLADTNPAGPYDVSGSKTWADGFAGARCRVSLNETFALFGRGDLGAGGSRFSWNAIGGVDIRLGSSCSLLAGYRALGADYSSGSGAEENAYDIVMHGPFVAFSFRF